MDATILGTTQRKRKTLDLSSYVGQTTNQTLISGGMETVDIGTVISFLAYGGGGTDTLKGESITRFCKKLSESTSDISVTLQFGSTSYELFPTVIGNNRKTYGFNVPVQDGGTNILVYILLFYVNGNLEINVFLK